MEIIAKNSDNTNVKTNEAKMFWFKSVENLNLGDIIPIWRFVESLDANEPKILPLIPMAPGIITSNPGNVSRKKVIFPSIIPAIKSPIAQINSEMRLSLMMRLCCVINSRFTDSGLRSFFCLSFTCITTCYHPLT